MTQQPEERIHHTQKVGLVLLSLFSVLVVVLGYVQFRSTIYGPFALAPIERDTDLAAIDDIFEDESVKLQQIDTDQDGINDFEELNFYNTSPYIADTDSDGVNDADEIAAGTDPICPSGSNCDAFRGETVATGSSTAGGIEPTFADTEALLNLFNAEEAAAPTEAAPNFETLPVESQVAIESILEDPEAIRELLRQNTDLSSAEIDAFPDDLLLSVGADLLGQQ